MKYLIFITTFLFVITGFGNHPPGFGSHPPEYGRRPSGFGNQPPGFGNLVQESASACEGLFGTFSYSLSQKRIFHPDSYSEGEPKKVVARRRDNNKNIAEKPLNNFFVPNEIIVAEINDSKFHERLTRAQVSYSAKRPLFNGISGAIAVARNKSQIAMLQDDTLILFLTRAYEMQYEFDRNINLLEWSSFVSEKKSLTSEDAVLLYELKSILWNALLKRGYTVEIIESKIGEFLDIGINNSFSPQGFESETKRDAIMKLIEAPKSNILRRLGF